MPPAADRRTAWIDASGGAAGDMLLAALLDAGADHDEVARALAGLGVEVRVEAVRRYGLRAALLRLHAPAAAREPRRLPDVLAAVDAAGLAAPARALAAGAFRRLAAAEARVHGVAPEEVHFHEVGALDSLADIVGVAAAAAGLGLLDPAARVVVSDIEAGCGRVATDHGELPVPVPAVLELLRDTGATLTGRHEGEGCTPTGAALLAELAAGFGPMPAMAVRAVGTGAGSREAVDHPNVVRVVVGDATVVTENDWASEQLVTVETTVDDLDPRLWPAVLDAVHAAGALDAWTTPALMRAGRPGQVLCALAPAATVDAVVHAVLTHTSTLGVRLAPVERRALRRDDVTVDVDGVGVRVKRGLLGGRVVTEQPEYADVRAAAERLGVPLKVVLERLYRTRTQGS